MNKLLVALALIAVPAAAQAMPASTFLAKGEVLRKKGAMALVSSDFKLLRNELNVAGAQLRNERLAAVKAGGKPNHCPPAKAGLNPDELLAHLRSIPVAKRGMSFKTAYASFLARKFPCPA